MQLLLGVQLSAQNTFNNFIVGQNQQVFDYLQTLFSNPDAKLIYLSGAPSSGKTHLLQAVCVLASELKRTSTYIPLKQLTDFNTEILTNLEELDVVCIDDIDHLVEQAEWEEALFHLYNRILASNTKLIISARSTPTNLAIDLADLKSRLSAMLCFNLSELEDHDRLQALQIHAKELGMNLPQAVAEFLLARCSRSMSDLRDILDKLAHATLQEQRALTIPFIKKTLNL